MTNNQRATVALIVLAASLAALWFAELSPGVTIVGASAVSFAMGLTVGLVVPRG